jgi:anti-anti-sigma factor
MKIYQLPERLDALSAGQTESELLEIISAEKPVQLVFDFSKTVYLSSAGLRVLLLAAKQMKGIQGTCLIRKIDPFVAKIICAAGFDKIIPIEASS